jgi:Ca-activated chloride channel family protein
VILLAPCLVGWSFFDPFHEHVEKGNEKAAEEASTALEHYDEARRVNPGSPIPDFNRGIVLSREGQTEEAGDAFLAAAASDDPTIAADALYNHGNTLLEAEQFAPAIEAYLRSLDLDPADDDARRNLEIAVQRLEEQQQQQEQQQQDQNQDENQDQQEQQQQPQDQGENEEQQQPENNESPQEEEQQPQPEPGPPEERLTREDAERLLNAIESDELKVLQQLLEQEQETRGVGVDW